MFFHLSRMALIGEFLCYFVSFFSLLTLNFQSPLLGYVSIEGSWSQSKKPVLFLYSLFMGRIRRGWPQTEAELARSESKGSEVKG